MLALRRLQRRVIPQSRDGLQEAPGSSRRRGTAYREDEFSPCRPGTAHFGGGWSRAGR